MHDFFQNFLKTFPQKVHSQKVIPTHQLNGVDPPPLPFVIP